MKIEFSQPLVNKIILTFFVILHLTTKKRRVRILYTSIVYFLLISSHFTFAQTEQQIKAELDKRGIDTFEEVQAELRKRGMSEEDARRQARLYGINYDEYLKKYILNGTPSDGRELQSIDSISSEIIGYTTDSLAKAQEQAPVNEIQPEETAELEYFGYDIFNNNPYANQQALVGNIDPGYLIGPGDELRVYLWGEAEFQFEGKVDVNGNLFIPNVGQVFVAGTSYEGLNSRLKEYLSKFYSGLKKTPQKIFLDVSLTKLRPIRIVVMGESNKPGSQLINAFATTLNSLYASGGIKTSGSLREIKVFRNNRLISTIDLYDYLTKGALGEDMRLMSNDVVFIPGRMNSISLKGEVNKEGVYELKGNEGLIDLLSFAGGLKPSAYTQGISIKRIRSVANRDHSSVFDREIITVDYNELLSKGINFKLQDGDEIIFNKVLDKFENIVSVGGSVFRPGDYQLKKGLKVKDLIDLAGGIQPKTYMDKVDLFRKDANGRLKFRSFSLTRILNNPNSPDNILLEVNDSLKVYHEEELKSLETVSIEGFVANPMTLLWRENLTLYDLIFMSANVEDLEYRNRILTSRGDILRYNQGSTTYDVISFDLDEVLNNRFNAVMKPKDKVILYSKDITEVLDKEVFVQGGVKKGGKYLLTDSMTVEDLIIQAGGFVRTAFRDSVTVTRENFDFSGNQISIVTKIPVDMDRLLGNGLGSGGRYYLKHNDRLTVNYIPGASDQRKVEIRGEVKFPGPYYLKSKKETLSELVKRAGGTSPNAYIPGARIYRNGNLLAVDFQKLLNMNDSKYDVILSESDSIYFPESVYTVKIEGEVANPALQKFQKGKKVRSYIANAGGKTKKGRTIYLTTPNGFTKKVGWLSNPRVPDGAVITVNSKKEKDPSREKGQFLKDFGTISAIISSTLTTIFLVERLN